MEASRYRRPRMNGLAVCHVRTSAFIFGWSKPDRSQRWHECFTVALVICPPIRRPPSESGADIDAGMCRRRLDMTGRCMKRRTGDEDVSQRRATRIIHGVWP